MINQNIPGIYSKTVGGGAMSNAQIEIKNAVNEYARTVEENITKAIENAEEAKRNTDNATTAAIIATDNANNAATAANIATDNIIEKANLTDQSITIPKPMVETYTDIQTNYPSPQNGWLVFVNDEKIMYRYNGSNSTWEAWYTQQQGGDIIVSEAPPITENTIWIDLSE